MGGDPISRARDLRRNATQPERTLWRELKQFRQRGHHFRRQVPIGPYFADFICHGARLAIEVDGHLHGETQTYDAQRDAFFRSQGYRVLRVTNADVASRLESVLATIQDQVEAAVPRQTPTPNPSPQGGGERG